jgi:branched-chain amino acid transport system ATP-binding protein
MATADVMLSVENLTVAYGNIKAVDDISFRVQEGEIVTLIGANGAGKSSTLRALSGVIPYSGQISYQRQDLRPVPAHRIVALGMAQVPEGRGIFGNLTVRENLQLATWQRKDREGVIRDFKRVFDLFPQLEKRQQQAGATLSGGEQQMLAVGRALMSNSAMMLLDEPSMGLAPMLVRDIFQIIGDINRAGTTILLVEQNAHMALSIASRAYVLETGRIILAGKGQELLGDPRVREAYLGC